MVDFFNTTGKRIRLLRQERRINQDALARELAKLGIDVGRTYISKLENNDVTPNGRVIAGLAQILNTTSDYLLLLTEDPFMPGEEEEEEEEPRAPPLSPEVQARADRVEKLRPEDREFILRTMDELIRFAESRGSYPTRPGGSDDRG